MDIREADTDLLKSILLTCDGKGKAQKELALAELLRREYENGRNDEWDPTGEQP